MHLPPRPAAARCCSRCSRCSRPRRCGSRESACIRTWRSRSSIWMIYAQGYNLLLGHSGLPSFGHGAFFGVGAYAFGLLQKNVSGNLWLDLAGAVLAAALAGAVVGAFISHRRGIYYALLTIAFGQVFWFVAIKWHSVTGGEDGLLNLKRPAGRFRLRGVPAEIERGAARVLRRCRWCWSSGSAGASSIRPSAARSPASARTRCARAFLGYRVWLCKWLVFVAVHGDRGIRRRAVRAGAAVGLPERDEPASVGVRRDDGADRRRTDELLGPAHRRGRSSSSRATCSARTPRRGCSGMDCCSWRSCCGSPRALPAVAGIAATSSRDRRARAGG